MVGLEDGAAMIAAAGSMTYQASLKYARRADALFGLSSSALVERGRVLASMREDLIASGVNPADLSVPLYPESADE